MNKLQRDFSDTTFRWPFRRYQELALGAYDNRTADHEHRCYLVMPPGSGKTALGLEIIRREANPAVVFCPNTAVLGQWLHQWNDFEPHTVQASTAPDAGSSLAFLTYQSLCNLNPEHEELDEVALDLWRQSLARQRDLPLHAANDEIARLDATGSRQFRRDLSRYRRQARRMIARGDDPERLLDLLHPNGQKLVERIAGWPACTIVLDECHHLLEMWGHLVEALVDTLGDNVLVVGLTATPPREMTTREATLYRNLFGYADFEVPTPAVVKEGDLAAYQELAFVTRPLPREAEYIAEQHLRFEELIARLIGHDFASRPLLEWVRSRSEARFSTEGAGISWTRFERDNPKLALAALRLSYRFDYPPPEGVRIREQHRQAMSADDWVALIEDFAINYLRFREDSRDQFAWEEIRAALPALGYVLTSRGIRRHVSPVDRVLSVSASKALGAGEVLRSEARELGEDLRALVLCDFERTNRELVAELRGVIEPDAGSAILLLETLIEDPETAALNPLLVTSQTVACAAETAERVQKWLAGAGEPSSNQLTVELLSQDRRTARITAPSSAWNSRTYVPLLTRFFEEGQTRCLIGTRGLLGEGWDARRVNVLVDLTTASTATAVHQMRGRSLRLDPQIPRKVANNWDIVCIDPEHPRGSADYDRFVRKHRFYFAPNREGEIEAGVSHVHHDLSPFGPPVPDEIPALNRDLLARSRERQVAWENWRIGEPYRNLEVHSVRVRAARSLGVPNQRMVRGEGAERVRQSIRTRGLVSGAVSGTGAAALALAGVDPLALLVPAAALVAGVVWSAEPLKRSLSGLSPSDNLDDFGRALLDALQNTGDLPTTVSNQDLRIVVQDDGFYRCYLAGVDDEQSRIFSSALDELLAPISTPRYIIPRYVADPPHTTLAALRIGLSNLIRDRAGSSVVYHSVPEVLARNRERVNAFEQGWNRHVSPGAALFYRSEEAQAIIAVQRGEDPFDVRTQMRVIWQ